MCLSMTKRFELAAADGQRIVLYGPPRRREGKIQLERRKRLPSRCNMTALIAPRLNRYLVLYE